MKRLALFALLVACIISVPLAAGPGEIVITPGVITSPSQAPQVCISKFKADSFVNVMLPGISYGFIVNERGTYCYQSDYVMDLAPGAYEVSSTVCHYTPGSIPNKCKTGPSVTLSVE